MRQMIDPSTIKVDTSNLAKLDMAKEGDTNYSSQAFSGAGGTDITEIYAGKYNGISVNGSDGKIRIGNMTNWTANYPNAGQYFTDYKNGQIRDASFNYNNIILFPADRSNNTHHMLTDKNVKTLFGDKSIYGTGNIDLYAHDITITKGTGKAFLTVYSSKNTNIDSLDDLKTIAGATFTKSCTGYINSKVIVAITETSFILADGTTEALTGATFVDTPAAI